MRPARTSRPDRLHPAELPTGIAPAPAIGSIPAVRRRGARSGNWEALALRPLPQRRLRLVAVQRPALQPEFLEERPCLADQRTRRQPEQLHDRVPVQVGPHPGEVLLRGQPGDPRLEVVVGPLQRAPPVRVAGGAVGADELVQPRQQVAGVGDVAAHGGVGPRARAVAVEAQVQEGQRGDVLDQRLGQLAARAAGTGRASRRPPRGGGSSPRRPRSNRRVAGLPMSCSSAASRSVRSGPSVLLRDRLLEHGQRVLVDVLVLVVLVALQPQRGQLGQDLVGQPGLR